jgi:hypothetical protein
MQEIIALLHSIICPLKYKGKCLFLGGLSFPKHSRHLGSSFEDIVYVRLCYLGVLPSLIDERTLLLDEECLFLHVVYLVLCFFKVVRIIR